MHKMASSCIANRIKKVLDKLVGKEQKAFIPGRYVGENIRLIDDTLYESKKQGVSGAVLAVNFEKKTFVSVSREYILEYLELLALVRHLSHGCFQGLAPWFCRMDT